MKQSIIALFVLITMLASAFAQENIIDSRLVGRALASNMWDSYYFYGEFSVDGGNDEHEFEGTMDLRGRVTSFSVEVDGEGMDIVTPQDTPLPGLPYVDEGIMTDLWIVLRAVSGEEVVASGHTNVPVLYEGDVISILIEPEEKFAFMEFNLPEGADSNKVVLNYADGDYLGWYDTGWGGFRLYLDLMKDPQIAHIVLGGVVIGSVWIDPYATDRQSEGNGLFVDLPGSVERLIFTENPDVSGRYSAGRSMINLDGYTKVGDEFVPAKIYIFDLEGRSASVTVSGNLEQINAEIISIDGNNQSMIREIDAYPRYGYTYDSAYIREGYGAVMVVITVTDNDNEEDYLNIGVTTFDVGNGKG